PLVPLSHVSWCRGLRELLSFPTRRSSDLGIQEILAAGRAPGVIIRGEAADKELSDRAKWPVLPLAYGGRDASKVEADAERMVARSEEHTSELQSRENLVCRLLLEKKKMQE